MTTPTFKTGSFGKYTFFVGIDAIKSFSNATVTHKTEYAKLKVNGAKPRLVGIAPDLDELSLDITLLKQGSVDPKTEIDTLKTYLTIGHYPLFLSGELMGDFVLTEMAVKRTHETGSVLVKAEVSLKLWEYEDEM